MWGCVHPLLVRWGNYPLELKPSSTCKSLPSAMPGEAPSTLSIPRPPSMRILIKFPRVPRIRQTQVVKHSNSQLLPRHSVYARCARGCVAHARAAPVDQCTTHRALCARLVMRPATMEGALYP